MNKLRLLGLLALFAFAATSAVAEMPREGRSFDRDLPDPRPMIIDNSTVIDANNIEMIVTNHGSFAYDLTQQDAGMWFPKGTDKTCVYASGLWIGAKVGGDIRVTAGSFTQEYAPGPILENGEPADFTDPRHKVYKIVKGDTESDDYVNWPADLGAPLDDEDKPLLIGDQTLWCVYNDADETFHNSDEGRTEPLGVEIQQTTFAFDWKGALGNVVFVKFKVINKGSNTLDSTYFAVWCDPDVGGASDDYVGCDTTLNVGFAYNATNTDEAYGAKAPCVGYDFFLGPIIRDPDTGEPIDTLGMASFNKYINGTDPRAFTESYNYMRGLNLDGSALIDPITQDTASYFVPGDPVEGTGWLDSDPADRRFMLNSGPFTMEPGDTQEVVVGIIVGQGNDRIGSVRVMKFYDQTAQVAFNLDFALPEPPSRPIVNSIALDNEIRLTWGLDSEDEPGDYTFEGYNVYQSASVSAAGPWTLVATYDLVDGVQTIEDLELSLEFGLPIKQPVQFGKDVGLRRYIELTEDKVKSIPLASGTPYYYRVGAYSYNLDPPEGLPLSLESLSDILEIIPQEPVAGTVLSEYTSAVTHGVEGAADPSDEQLHVEVVDPFALTGHTYKLIYEESDPPDTLMMLNNLVPYAFDYHWKLIDQTTTETVFEYGINRNGDDDYPVIDGFVPRVEMGVPIGSVDYLDASGSPSDALQGVDVGFHFALNGEHGGGVDYGVTFFGSTVTVTGNFDAFHNVEIRFSSTETQMAYRYERPGYGYVDFVEVPFQVWDIDDDRQLNACIVEWVDSDVYDGTWGPDATEIGGREYLFVNNSDYDEAGGIYDDDNWGIGSDVLYALWLRMKDETSVIEDGSKIVFNKSVPSTDADYFTFSTTAPDYDAGEAKSALSAVRAVPNPYFAKSAYELDQFSHVIKFSNLPEKCTIRVFNLAGDLVRTLDKNDANTSIVEWNLLNEKEIPVASGFYIYHVDAPDIGSTYGRMAIFLEKERLNTF